MLGRLRTEGCVFWAILRYTVKLMSSKHRHTDTHTHRLLSLERKKIINSRNSCTTLKRLKMHDIF